MPRQHVLVTAKQSGDAETKTLNGREHLVFPAVLVQEQVLPNNVGRTFLPAEEIVASAEDWNGIDVVIRHPTKNGQPISARDPDVLNAAGVGRIWNARVEGKALKSEVWIDLVSADDVEDAEEVLNVVNSGEPAELSTGFGARISNTPGTFDGEEYDVVLRDIRPDHLALLVEEKGACSLEDGCGLNVNAEADAETIAGRIWAHMKRLVPNQELSLDDIRELVRDAAEERWGGPDTFVFVAELFEDDAIVNVDESGEADVYYRVGYTVDEEARTVELAEEFTEVERITEFVPVGNGLIEARHRYEPAAEADEPTKPTTHPDVRHIIDFAPSDGGTITPRDRYLVANTREERTVTREDLINALCKCDEVSQDREALEEMEPDELAELANEAGVGEESEDEPDPTPDPEPEPTEEEKAKATNEAPEWAKPLMETVESLNERMGKLEEETEPARNQTAEERQSLIDAICASTEYEEAELEPKPLTELKKLHNATVTKPRNYIGNGPPRPASPSKNDLGFEVNSTLGAGPGKSPSERKES